MENENLKIKLDAEYNQLVAENDIEIKTLTRQNKNINASLTYRKNEEAKRQVKCKEEYDNLLSEINAIKELENIENESLSEKLKEKSKDYKKLYSNFVDGLDKKYDIKKEETDKKINDLKTSLEKEKEKVVTWG